MPCPLSLAEMASRRGLQILQFNEKKGWTVFIVSLFPFPIIRSGFLVPGPSGFNHVVQADDRDKDYIVGGVE